MDKRLGCGRGAFAFGEARQRPCRAVRNGPNGLWRIKEVSASGPPLKKAMRDGLSQTHEAGRLNHHRPIRGFVRHEPSVFQKDGGPADIQAALLHSLDRKSTRLNSSHLVISYAVFCLKTNNTAI